MAVGLHRGKLKLVGGSCMYGGEGLRNPKLLAKLLAAALNTDPQQADITATASDKIATLIQLFLQPTPAKNALSNSDPQPSHQQQCPELQISRKDFASAQSVHV